MNILLIDDDVDSGEALAEYLNSIGHQALYRPDPTQALALFDRQPCWLVITDLRMPTMDGLEVMRRIHAHPAGHDTAVIILTGHADTESAITALRQGAYDYLRKPVNTAELELVVERCANFQELHSTNHILTEQFDATVAQATTDLRSDLKRAQTLLKDALGMAPLIAVSTPMRELLTRAALYHANPDIPVMLEGETGVGKEVLARLIHHGPAATDKPFVALNCAAIPAALFESELFGYAAGAFTGGLPAGAKGKLELADTGTLFLDEIGDMPLELQPKLLRAIQERCFYRVGGLRRLDFHARVICASNRNLETLSKTRKLRPDLFYRLKVGHMVIPPLRDRRADIQPLAEFFLRRAAEHRRRQFQGFSADAIQLLQSHAWPGNVRELENAIERAVLEDDAPLLTANHLLFLTGQARPANTDMQPAQPCKQCLAGADLTMADLPESFDGLPALEARIVQAAMAKFSGNITQAARYLGLSRNALYSRIHKATKDHQNASH